MVLRSEEEIRSKIDTIDSLLVVNNYPWYTQHLMTTRRALSWVLNDFEAPKELKQQ